MGIVSYSVGKGRQCYTLPFQVDIQLAENFATIVEFDGKHNGREVLVYFLAKVSREQEDHVKSQGYILSQAERKLFPE